MNRKEFNAAFTKFSTYVQGINLTLNNISDEDAKSFWIQYELIKAKTESDNLLRTLKKDNI